MEDFHKREDNINEKNEKTFTRWMTKGMDNVKEVTQIIVPLLTASTQAALTPHTTSSVAVPTIGSITSSSGTVCNQSSSSLFSSPILVAAAAQQQLQQQQLQTQLLLNQQDNLHRSKDKAKKSKKEKKAKKKEKKGKKDKKAKKKKHRKKTAKK